MIRSSDKGIKHKWTDSIFSCVKCDSASSATKIWSTHDMRRATSFPLTQYQYLPSLLNMTRGQCCTKSTLPPPVRSVAWRAGVIVAGSLAIGSCYAWTALQSTKDNEEKCQRKKQFLRYASKQYHGEQFMTPQDFIESIISDYPRPRY